MLVWEELHLAFIARNTKYLLSVKCLFYFYFRSEARLSLHTSNVTLQTRAYPGFCSMKLLGVFLLPTGWDASPSQGYLSAFKSSTLIYTPGWREAL